MIWTWKLPNRIDLAPISVLKALTIGPLPWPPCRLSGRRVILLRVEVRFAILADAANKAENGKLNLLGTFDRISAKEFPATHLGAKLVVRLAMSSSETGKEHDIAFVLIDEDGKELAASRGKMKIKQVKAVLDSHVDLIVDFPVMPFPKPGNYRIDILVNDEQRADVKITMEQI